MLKATSVINAGIQARATLDKLETQLVLSGMLTAPRQQAMKVMRAGLVMVLDFMPELPTKVVEMGDTTIAKTLEELFKQ